MPVSKKLRFEVFKRDSFTCQYCGKSAPEVILHLDHIQPRCEDGGDEITNLITSCADCNLGKGPRLISDESMLSKQKKQLDELNERKEQIEMMAHWAQELREMNDSVVDIISQAFEDVSGGLSLNDSGRKQAKTMCRKHGLANVLEAIEIAGERYIKLDPDGKPDHESAELAWNKVGGIAYHKSQPDYIQRLYRIKNYTRNRFYYFNDWQAMSLMKRAYDVGIPFETIEYLANQSNNWTDFREGFEDSIERWADG